MKPSAKTLLPIAIVVLGIASAWGIVQQTPPKQSTQPPPALPKVDVLVAQPETLRIPVRSQGTVLPLTESDLVAEVPGRIVEVADSFVNGGFFRAGERLLMIDPRDYDLAIVKARAEVEEAREALARAEAEAEQAEREWKTIGKGRPRALALRLPQLKEKRAKLDAAKAVLEEALLARSRTEIRAPFDGRVENKATDIGQYVEAGTQLARIFGVDAAEVRLPLDQGQLAYLDLPLSLIQKPAESGTTVTLRAFLAGEERSWHGRIVRTEGLIDEKTRMLYVVARIDDPYGYHRDDGAPPLPMGLFVEAEIEGREWTGITRLPRTAVRGDDRVIVVDEDRRVRWRRVRVLRGGEEGMIAVSGLDAGEQVVVTALQAATEGMRVDPLPISEVARSDRRSVPGDRAERPDADS